MPPEREIDPADLADLIDSLAEYLSVSHEEAKSRVFQNIPRGEVTSYHGHVVVSGRDPEASPRYFAVLPY